MISDEHAKAAQEIAKLGQRGLETTDKAGAFIDRTFGDALAHLGGAAADWTVGFRIRNLARTVAKTRAYLDKRGIEDFDRISARLGIPLIEAIQDESDDDLQDVWAAYTANALDPQNQKVTANRNLINIIRQLEPEDLKVLNGVSLSEINLSTENLIEKFEADFDLNSDALHLSLARMSALGLFNFDSAGTVYLVAAESNPVRAFKLSVTTTWGSFEATPAFAVLKNAVAGPTDEA